jgi:hypothetical protein
MADALFGFAGVVAVPAPDGPVVGSAILLALQEETRNPAEDVEPAARIAADLDLSSRRAERTKRLVEQVAHHANLRLVAVGANVADREVVVDAHVALDETGHVPGMLLAIVALKDQQVTPPSRAAVALASALLIGMGERGADLGAQRGVVARLGRADSVRDGRVVLLALHPDPRPTA